MTTVRFIAAVLMLAVLLALQALADLWKAMHTLRTPTGSPADPA